MNGQELYLNLIAKNNKYSQTLRTMYSYVSDELFPLLEKANKENKKLTFNRKSLSKLRQFDGCGIKHIILE